MTVVPTVPRVGSAVFVIDVSRRLLLGRREKDPHRGRWVLPGGKVEMFETVAQAARREVLEETGLEIRVGRVIDVVEIIDPPHEHRIVVYTQGHPVGGRLNGSSDLSSVRFFARHEIAQLDLTPAVRGVLTRQGWITNHGRD